MRLSDSFIKQDGEEACLECTATMLNINYGYNTKLMEACRELYEYSYLIEQIRIGLRTNLPLTDAVDRAVENCIENDILKNFLLRHRAEVTNMILEEFDLNKHIKSEKDESYADGEEAQHRRFSQLIQRLLADSRNEDIEKAAADFEYCKALYKEYKIV